MDEGYVKFECEWEYGPPPPSPVVEELNGWRQRLHGLGLIGMYDNGVGFGNLSRRLAEGDTFVITATATGALRELGPEHYTVVTGADERQNRVWCRGPGRASSESMTHAMLYRLAAEANAVIHAHGPVLWQRALGRVPTTRGDVPYGTPAMVDEVVRLFRETDVASVRFFAMAGHEEGIVSFGSTVDVAGERLVQMAAELGVSLARGPS